MENPIKNFAFDDRLVRVVMQNDEPWFVAADVCNALGIKNASDAVKNLDDDEKGIAITDTLRGEQKVIILCEAALYRLAFASRKPEAKRFTRWVAHEVLPTIRKTGSYSVQGAAPDTAPCREIDAPGDDPKRWHVIHKLQAVQLCGRLYGAERARGLWVDLGLPVVPPAAPTGREEARECLSHLLEAPAEHGLPPIRALLERALDDEEEARLILLTSGVRVLQESDGFLVANRHPRLASIFAGTEWQEGRWARVLRRLSGVTPFRPLAFGDLRRRGTFVPSDYLDDRTVPALATHQGAHAC